MERSSGKPVEDGAFRQKVSCFLLTKFRFEKGLAVADFFYQYGFILFEAGIGIAAIIWVGTRI